MRRARKLYLDGGYGDWAGDPVVEELASSMAAAVRTGGRASGDDDLPPHRRAPSS
jgi:hypothetical protein